jgi:hypothetical protein
MNREKLFVVVPLLATVLLLLAARYGDGHRGVVCGKTDQGYLCRLKKPKPGAYSVSFTKQEVVVVRNGPPGPTKIVFQAEQP